MIKVRDFQPRLAADLPETYALLRSSNLTVHPCVALIVLHGSRGLSNRYRINSDIDLTLIADLSLGIGTERLQILRTIYETTIKSWKSSVELDLAVVFDQKQCQLKCFHENTWNAELCTLGGMDCFGLYKQGKGFRGLVTDAAVQVKRMYPCLIIWERT
jgi:hypothetical protein